MKKGVRTHKTIKEIKERYNYQLSNIQQDEIDEIIKEILMALKTTGVCPSIIDIINKLGFTVYNFPFEKDGVDDEFCTTLSTTFIFVHLLITLYHMTVFYSILF